MIHERFSFHTWFCITQFTGTFYLWLLMVNIKIWLISLHWKLKKPNHTFHVDCEGILLSVQLYMWVAWGWDLWFDESHQSSLRSNLANFKCCYRWVVQMNQRLDGCNWLNWLNFDLRGSTWVQCFQWSHTSVGLFCCHAIFMLYSIERMISLWIF